MPKPLKDPTLALLDADGEPTWLHDTLLEIWHRLPAPATPAVDAVVNQGDVHTVSDWLRQVAELVEAGYAKEPCKCQSAAPPPVSGPRRPRSGGV